MENLPQPLTDPPSALARAITYLLVPVALIALVPLLLLFIIILHLLALVHGARIFVFSFTGKPPEPEAEMQPPHFDLVPKLQLGNEAAPKALPDDSPLPPKG